MSKTYALEHASTLTKPGQIQIDPDYYPGKWVIWVSDANPVSTLIAT